MRTSIRAEIRPLRVRRVHADVFRARPTRAVPKTSVLQFQGWKNANVTLPNNGDFNSFNDSIHGVQAFLPARAGEPFMFLSDVRGCRRGDAAGAGKRGALGDRAVDENCKGVYKRRVRGWFW